MTGLRNSMRDFMSRGVSRDEGGEGFAAESKRNTQHTHIMKTFKLTLAAMMAAAISAFVLTAGTPNVLVSPRAAQAQPTVVSGGGGDRDYVHGIQPVGSPRGRSFAGDFRSATGLIPVYVRPVAASTVSPRAAETFPWLKNDSGMHDTSAFAACKPAKKGECKMSCCKS